MSVKESGEKHHHHHHHHHKFYRHLLAGLLAFVVLVLFTILVIYLVLRPTKPRFLLQDASVLALNLSGGTPPAGAAFLTTTMQVTLATRNPNDRVGVYYDKLDVYAAYEYQQVTLATAIPPTYQGHNDVVVWSPFLYGVNVPLAPYLAVGVAEDQNAGVMLLHVKVRGRLRWKVGSWTSGHYHISASCPALLGFGAKGGGAYSPVIRFQQGSACTVDV